MAAEPWRAPKVAEQRRQRITENVDRAVQDYLEQRAEPDVLPTLERELPLRSEQTGDSRLLGGGFERRLNHGDTDQKSTS